MVFRAPPAFANYVEASKANEDLIKRIGEKMYNRAVMLYQRPHRAHRRIVV